MGTLWVIFLIYGIACVLIGLLKPPFIFNMGKFKVMAKMFKGERNVQIFVIVWGLLFIALALIFG